MNVPDTDQISEPCGPDRSMFTPRETEAALDKYIIGQNRAKRAVAIALRNRWRRQQVAPPLRDEIAPKNIIMIGPTGVGKTEIARRLAILAQSPFLKVEASKFTEVGYVGRDVESMIRDLIEIAVNMVRREEESVHEEKVGQLAEERLLDLLLPRPESHVRPESSAAPQLSLSRPAGVADAAQDAETRGHSTREKLRRMLHDGRLDERLVELDLPRQPAIPMVEVFSSAGLEEMQSSIRDSFSKMFSKQEKKRRVKVPEALKLLAQEELEKLIDIDAVTKKAIMRTEESGIVFIDEIDKIASRGGGGGSSPDVSREGVQRDLLPIVEGATVSTKYGMVRTDHILFVASGAFHLAKPSDLVPELQGRFPVRVELDALGEEDFYRILVEPENALVRQYVALLATESVDLHFTDDGIREMARMAAEVNRATEDIGARRLHTIMERVVDKISYEAPDMEPRTVTINGPYVAKELADIVKDEDLSRFVL